MERDDHRLQAAAPLHAGAAPGPAAPPPEDRGPNRLGELLLAKGWVRADHLAHALELQRRSGERLGTILLAFGYVQRRHLYQALSELWRLPYVELQDLPPPADHSRLPLDLALAEQAAVYRLVRDEVWVAVAERPSQRLQEELARLYPERRLRFAVTTHWDLSRYLRRTYGRLFLDRAVYELYRKRREVSAYTVLTPAQFALFAALLAALLVGLAAAPQATLGLLTALVTGVFALSVLFKFLVAFAGAERERTVLLAPEEVEALRPAELPRYTILVPVYREASVVGGLLRHLADLDYPREKLEVLVLVEEDDEETWQAAKAARPPDFVHLVRIPHGLPKTKPKACNVGLAFARGRFLVIYDAEDRPEPDQLKKAVAAFRKGPPELICVQAALNYYNARQNWLTRMFTLEYSYWFDYMLPGLDRLGLPIPLGGTSNHFRTDLLRELAGWDPFNVTEDADLGIRAAQFGYRVGVLDSTTFEEANARLVNWLRQRSRWIKGYMQTALVHARHPLRLFRTLGPARALGFALLVAGTPLTFLAYLPTLLLYLGWLLLGWDVGWLFPSWALYVGLFNLLFGNLLAIHLAALAVFKRGNHDLVLYALAHPLYWLLHAIAAYKALGQLVTRPFYWEKTVHGLAGADACSDGIPGSGSRAAGAVAA